MLVRMPPTSYSRSARIMRAMAASRVPAHTASLASSGIVFHGNGPAGVDAAVEADAGAVGPGQARDLAGVRQEMVVRVLGVDAALDGRAAPGDLLLGEGQARAGGDLHLQAHQVEAGDQFGDGMLHLQARVHFEEVEAAVSHPPGTRPCRRCSSRRRAPRGWRPRPWPGAFRDGARPAATGTLRSPSGGGAAASTRARPGGSCCRGGRR